MSKLIYEFFSKNFLEKYFLFGKRWILLVPALGVLALFWFIQQFLGLPDFKTTITNGYFILPSLIIIATGIAYYVWINSRPPPSDRFIVAVTKFQPVPESAMQEASILQHRVVQAFRDRMASQGIKGTAVALHETIDPSATDGHRQALILGRHYQAHLVIWGAVRLDEEYYFKPSITRLVTQPYRFFPTGEVVSTEIPVPVGMSLAFKQQKVSEVTDLAAFICAMARLNQAQYPEAVRMLDSIALPSAEVWFYKGFCRLQLNQPKEARSCFERACDQDPNFVYAWIYAGIAAEKSRDYKAAKEFFTRAANRVRGSTDEKLKEDWMLVAVVLESSISRLLELNREVGETLTRGERDRLEGEVYYAQGQLDFNKGDYNNAFLAFDLAIKLDPTNRKAWEFWKLSYQILAGLENLDVAQDDYLLARGEALLGNKEDALKHLSAAIEKNPKYRQEAANSHEFIEFRQDEAFLKLVAGGEGESIPNPDPGM